MPDNEQMAIERMRTGFYAFEETIDLSGLGVTPDNVGRLFVFAIKNDPYLFFVDTKLSYYYKKDPESFIIRPRYTVSRDEAYDMIAFCIDEVASLASRARHPLLDDAERALLIHDIICAEYSYDTTYQNDNVYKFLSMGTGTCQGYTWAYMAVMRELGIECCYVASDTINHIWNMVKIDGEWYHCDLTWDDGAGGVSRRHFLCSDDAAEERGHRDWYSAFNEICSSVLYDTFDFSSMTHIVGSGDADHDGRVGVTDLIHILVGEDGKGSACIVCADVTGDLCIDCCDADAIRQKILDEAGDR